MLAAQFAAYFMVTGFAIYGLTRSSPIIPLMIIDTVPILIGSLYAASSLALTMADQVHPAVTLAIALMILNYHVVSLYNVHDTWTKLGRAEDRAITVERLEAFGRLTGGLAHDFNNILTAVLGHLDLYDHLTASAKKGQLRGRRPSGRHSCRQTDNAIAVFRPQGPAVCGGHRTDRISDRFCRPGP